MNIFNGYHFAEKRELQLKQEIEQLESAVVPKVAAILFQEDQGSQLYTRLKKETAERVGIEYEVHTFSMRDPVSQVQTLLADLNHDPHITGIIIQKPWRKSWLIITGQDVDSFNTWWRSMTQAIEVSKDVDGLHPQTLQLIKENAWKEAGRVLPATCKAVLEILETEKLLVPGKKAVILGKSDILGLPLHYQMTNLGLQTDMIGSRELEQRLESDVRLTDADIVVSATGRYNLITGDLLKQGVAVVDVGEPKPDVEFNTVSDMADFITPVPGGVGPVTVVCLLENTLELFKHNL